ncbi:hypothetical protein V5799_020983 [Amblyomma americanum]|uniref:Uncharacterized protein n=1 Tax=Amblyomma americanum TaxID=6943 RepID=A0AAQ4FS95_AMBAM
MEAASLVEEARRGTDAATTPDADEPRRGSPDKGCPALADNRDDDDRSPFDDVDLRDSSPESQEEEVSVRALRPSIYSSRFSAPWDASRSPLSSPVLSRKKQHVVLVPTHSSSSLPDRGSGGGDVSGVHQVAWRQQALWTSLVVTAIVTMVVGAAVALAITTAKSSRRSLALMRALRHWYAAANGTVSPLEYGRIPPAPPAKEAGPTSPPLSEAANDTRHFVLVFR